jgi:hypothetical protein
MTPWTGDQPVVRPLPTDRTTQAQNKRTRTSMPPVGFEPTISMFCSRQRHFIRGHCDSGPTNYRHKITISSRRSCKKRYGQYSLLCGVRRNASLTSQLPGVQSKFPFYASLSDLSLQYCQTDRSKAINSRGLDKLRPPRLLQRPWLAATVCLHCPRGAHRFRT